jgi:hypothetical protein
MGTLGRGLLVGAASLPALLPVTPLGRGVLDAILAARGLADPQSWRLTLLGLAFGLPLAFGALGLLGHALARPGCARPVVSSVAAMLLALLAGTEAWGFARALRSYDIGGDLAAAVGAPHGATSTRAFLLFVPEVPVPLAGRVPFMSIEGVSADDGTVRRTWDYLQRRRFRTAVAWHALVHLHDCASLRWDSDESLRVDLAALDQNPMPIFAGLLMEKLSQCATSPANHALLRQVAAPGRFRPDLGWLRTLGLLQHRFGDEAAATTTLRRSGLTPAQVRQALGAGAPLTTGSIAGRIEVDGHTGSGLLVGVLPAARWQTLIGAPRPFELRWVAAAAPTDTEGRFRLRELGEGEYVLIVMGEPALLPVHGQGARAAHAPGLLHLDLRHPSHDLGTLRIITRPRAGAPPGADAT